ncbi:hypothetical protein M758_9G184700 [Ceratodon purpureus]|nr:hypothetical protein M758_9G184700 [Ceratodon purpureus]KAG0606998.1 hypothetical protein M758_9G184700 [Ceratodon purpureus]KAG0606999.1 hypothetical protein M758_9G184700 [Ceratodon purpureus]KAG0607000.1 hypothetical protein M758_9G184700 [Ceratodon purpureus]KAG0607001.1 hypothetical protein M758_9G184700 [Ceratodon purpureus]
MERKVFISYLKNDSNDSRFAEDLRRALERQRIRVVNDASDSQINVALFVLTYPYLVNDHATKEAEKLFKRGGVWCIPIYHGITPVQVQSMTQTPQARSVWQNLNNLCTPVYEDGRSKPDVELVVKHIREGPTQPEKVYDVFISHAGEVKSFCKKLKSALESHRLSVFLDVFAIRGGPGPMPFSTEINNAIAKSKIVVVILSHHFESKFWTTEEIRLCREKEVRLLPVYYHISREMCIGRLEVAGDPEKENLNWLYQHTGIENFGKHAGEQLPEGQLIDSVVEEVRRYVG